MRKQPGIPVSLMTTLLVSPSERDHALLNAIFSRSNWRLLSAYTREEALGIIRSQVIPVVICVEDPPDGTWKLLLKEGAHQPAFPKMIVSSRAVDDHLWTEVLHSGAYDLLAMPWDAREVLKLNSLAFHSWAFAQRSTAASFAPQTDVDSLSLAAAVCN